MADARARSPARWSPRAAVAGTAARRVGGALRLRRVGHRRVPRQRGREPRRVALRSRHRDVPRLRDHRRARRRSRSAYREAAIYRAGMTISDGVATAIAVPTAQTDLKYHYTPGHGAALPADRRRPLSARPPRPSRDASPTMWNPEYDGGDDFWTERHAGFALLAHEWAADGHRRPGRDDRGARRRRRRPRSSRCRRRTRPATPIRTRAASRTPPTAHGETYGYVGCSPWMSAILADGARRLRAPRRRHARRRTCAQSLGAARPDHRARRSRRDRQAATTGWASAPARDEIDDYDEHWGESAYVVAHGLALRRGRTDAGAASTAADAADRGPQRRRRGRPAAQLQLAVPLRGDDAVLPALSLVASRGLRVASRSSGSRIGEREAPGNLSQRRLRRRPAPDAGDRVRGNGPLREAPGSAGARRPPTSRNATRSLAAASLREASRPRGR